MSHEVDQQATPTEAEIAWLAGIIEGEGTLSMSCHPTGRGDKYQKIAVIIRIYNTDAGIILKALEIIEKMGVSPHIKERPQKPMSKEGGGKYSSPDPMITLHIGVLGQVLKVLTRLNPWFFGDKSARAKIMIRFLERRLGMIAAKGNKGGRVPYDKTDWLYLQEFMVSTRSTKKEFVERVLNEFEQCA